VLKDVDGLGVYQEIKRVLPEAKVVIMTGYPEKAKEMGCETDFTCIYKPFDIEDILKYIEKVKTKIV